VLPCRGAAPTEEQEAEDAKALEDALVEDERSGPVSRLVAKVPASIKSNKITKAIFYVRLCFLL